MQLCAEWAPSPVPILSGLRQAHPPGDRQIRVAAITKPVSTVKRPCFELRQVSLLRFQSA